MVRFVVVVNIFLLDFSIILSCNNLFEVSNNFVFFLRFSFPHLFLYFFVLGTHADCRLNLQTFGIPAETLPLSEDGKEILTDYSTEAWTMCRAYERKMHNRTKDDGSNTTEGSKSKNLSSSPLKQGDYIAFPGRLDVLLGRGRNLHGHMGNIKFRYFVGTYVDVYESASKDEKKDMSADIVRRLQRDINVRFLKKEETGWVVVDDEVARLKVSHVFRSIRRNKVKQRQSKGNGSAENSHDTNQVEEGEEL